MCAIPVGDKRACSWMLQCIYVFPRLLGVSLRRRRCLLVLVLLLLLDAAVAEPWSISDLRDTRSGKRGPARHSDSKLALSGGSGGRGSSKDAGLSDSASSLLFEAGRQKHVKRDAAGVNVGNKSAIAPADVH